jgi:hypothetical protein
MTRDDSDFLVILCAIAVWIFLLATSAGREILNSLLGFYEYWG